MFLCFIKISLNYLRKPNKYIAQRPIGFPRQQKTNITEVDGFHSFTWVDKQIRKIVFGASQKQQQECIHGTRLTTLREHENCRCFASLIHFNFFIFEFFMFFQILPFSYFFIFTLLIWVNNTILKIAIFFFLDTK